MDEKHSERKIVFVFNIYQLFSSNLEIILKFVGKDMCSLCADNVAYKEGTWTPVDFGFCGGVGSVLGTSPPLALVIFSSVSLYTFPPPKYASLERIEKYKRRGFKVNSFNEMASIFHIKSVELSLCYTVKKVF